MHLKTSLSVTAALVASASANAVAMAAAYNAATPYARVVNRCSYPVNLWSVYKGEGCPVSEMITLKTGQMYNENFQNAKDGVTGISIKITKDQKCGGSDITQLEYFLNQKGDKYSYNYLDVSYIDCPGGSCPSKTEGYYLQAGDQQTGYASSAGNTWCPILSCSDAASCAKMSYILPDDPQTKSCALGQNLSLYLCGGGAPSGDYVPAGSSSAPAPSSPAPVKSSAALQVQAAAITNAPDVPASATLKVKTQVEIVYITKVEYVNAKKRHVHGHARRHAAYHA